MSSVPKSSPNKTFLQTAGYVLLAGLVLWSLLKSHSPEAGGLTVGERLPPIQAEGWINGKAPTAEELKGKVLVIDAWASWCGPCRAKAPEMVALYDKYHPQGVEFIGLTSESYEELDAMQGFLTDAGIQWRNGYGATGTLMALGAEYIPMVWVVDRQEKIAWSQASSNSIEDAIEKALAAK